MPHPNLKQQSIPPRNITKHDLVRWQQLGDEARTAETRSRALRKDQASLAGEIKDWVLDRCGRSRTIDRSGYRLSIVSQLKLPRWLDEFRDRHGQDEVDAVKARQGSTDRLQIEKL